ncbi:transglycosylase SLT domain-containing protein [Bacillus amyloliquefaciens]|uniref:transglycosylase SLT domain-containing protein n=1 Tax=Bacillus amyloliquefaciens TaxID=1390 RepID=UPI001CA3BACA|nr:phage tail tape measure protein [Bacillus amyloliquefaciens]QZY31566.1 transglycosylase SLT domain-containing protein [Bacillus amyloliquefaciens]
MAKLTATFDLHDKMTKKLRKIQGNAERLQRAANGPLVFEADDRTQRTIRRIDRSATQLTRRPRSLDVRLDDQASGGLTRIRRQTEDITEGEHEVRVSVDDRATPRLRLIRGSLSDLQRSDATPTVSVRDRASGDLNSLRHRVSDLDGSEATPTVSIKDKASAALDAIQKRLDSLKTVTITLAAAGGLSGGAIMNSGKNAMAQDAYVSATSNVSKKDAGRMTDDIFYKNKVGGSREEVSSALKGLSQLTGASGRALAELTESSSKIAQLMNADQAEVDRAFSAMYNNLKMTGKESGDTIAYIYRNAGDQADDLLDTMNEYSSTFRDLKLTGGQIANAMIKGTKGGARNFDNLADSMREFNIRRTEMSDSQVDAFKTLFGAKETKKMFKGFKDGSIGGEESLFRVAKALSKVKDKTKRAAIATELIGTQYEDLKQPILDMAEGIGTSAKTSGELERSFTKLRDNNPMTPVNDAMRDFESISKDMGTSLLTGLGPAFDKISSFINSKEGQEKLKEIKKDIADLGAEIGDKLNVAIEWSVNHWDDLKTAIKVVIPSLIGLIGYLKILRPLLKGIGTVGSDAAGVIRKLIPKRTPKAGTNTQSERRNSNRNASTRGRESKTATGPTSLPRSGSLTCCCCSDGGKNDRIRRRRGKRVLGRRGNLNRMNPSDSSIVVSSEWLERRRSGRTVGTNPTRGSRPAITTTRSELYAAGRAAGGTSKFGKVLSPLKSVGKFAKGLPLLGTALAATDLIRMNKDNVGEKIGSAGGGLAGAATGAAIGSVIPGVGTAIGGIVGGIAGTMGGSSLGKAFDGSEVKKKLDSTLFDQKWWSEKWSGIKSNAKTSLDGLSDTWSHVKEKVKSTLFNSEWWSEKWSGVKSWAQDKWNSASSVWESVKEKIKSTLFSEKWWSGKWEGVKGWAQSKWDSASSVWQSVKGKLKSTLFSEKWWSGKWESVKSWSKNKWDNAKSIWKSVKSSISETLFSKKWWSEKWQSVKELGSSILGGVKEVGGKVASSAKKTAGKAWGYVKSGVNYLFGTGKEKPKKHATGGYITKPTISWIGEAGKEFVIPVENNKGRGKMLLSQAASKLGMSVVDDIASASSAGGEPATSLLIRRAAVTASVSPIIDTSSLDEQATSFGQQFTKGFDQGIGDNVVSMESWKQKNVGQPMNNLISYSPNYGKQVVNGYAKGQNSTSTGTDGFLQTKVKMPFQNTVNKSSSWGSGTIKGFASGQNSSQTGTDQYVSTHINKPFIRSKESSNGWGSGMIGNFVSGMTSKASEVNEAAKELAKKVEKAFREELDIHSPSRVMMSLGRFASIGIVKGLDSVDVKKFAEKQAGSLAAAYSGMGAVSGNVKQWLMAAIMATKTPMSWLPGLMTIAQHESGGNPKAINLWDSNAKAGHPSQGLMQTILSTFNAHKLPGMNNILNPIHNAAAAIGYIKSRYGSINNVPGIRSMRHGGPYVGYANGGLITKEQIARVGEGNKREWIIPEERGIRGRYLLAQAAKALGMEVTDPSQKGQTELSSGQITVATTGSQQTTVTASGGKEVIIQFNGDQHFHNDQDMNSLVAKIKQALVDELEQDINIGTKGVVAFD